MVHEWAAPFAIIFVAGLVQGITGFAFGILCMALLTLVWDLKTANVVVTLMATYCSVYTLWSIRHTIRWPAVKAMLLGLLLGALAGTWALVSPGCQVLLRYLVAVSCLGIALQNWRLSRPGVELTPTPSWMPLVAGLTSGFLSASISTGGPPVLWYVYRQPWTRDEWKSTTLAVFVAAAMVKLVVWVGHDLRGHDLLFTHDRLLAALILLPATTLGSAVGVALFEKVNREQLRHAVCVLLVLMAVMIFATPPR